jgi:hypothetical protein
VTAITAQHLTFIGSMALLSGWCLVMGVSVLAEMNRNRRRRARYRHYWHCEQTRIRR